jgi:hypothetical protein
LAEGHGKNSRDQHFSTLSQFVKNIEINNQIRSTGHLINELELQHIKSNAERAKKNLKEINTIFLGNYLFI